MNATPVDPESGVVYPVGLRLHGRRVVVVGGEDLLRSRGVEVVNLDLSECVELMRAFIAERPDVWNEDIGTD